jgi:5-oxoprolinase (ATP-hydrolysing) subunit A
VNRLQIDLNADLGESFGVYRYGADEEMLDLVSSANVACGFHAGDPLVMRESVNLAYSRGVRIGAHVGLPDLLGFGRRTMALTRAEAYAYTTYQVGALSGFLCRDGIPMTHVKPHGALYMAAADDHETADGIAEAVYDLDPRLQVYTLPESALAGASRARGLRVVEEFFADRPYVGTTVSMFDWTPTQLGSPDQAAERVRVMLEDDRFGNIETICVHSDTPSAAALMTSVRSLITDSGVDVGGVSGSVRGRTGRGS